ncbi:hypothetical protein ACTXMW_16250 [Brachybacterium paraconglomeratum]|uniref:hypothetical protein n=1 Tax=Brachybacterium paraconglomeratum TaxID=173362 RepID=UPI003FD5CEEB
MNQHIPQNHPVAQLLRGSANAGRALTGADLASLDAASQHSAGGSFAGMKPRITAASQRIAALHAEGRYQEAREHADETAAELAGTMTEQQRTITSSSIAKAESNARDLEDIDAMVRRDLAGN